MKSMSPLLDSNLLRRIAPYTLAGYSRWRQIVNTDGAIPARIKALYVAVAANTKGYGEMAERELTRAHQLGLTYEEASSAGIILSSCRGEGAALRFLALLDAEYQVVPVAAAMPVIDVEAGQVEQNFLNYFGAMPPSLGKLIDLLPVGSEAYYLMREGTINGTPLGAKYSELMLVTILAADYSDWTNIHMKGAKTAGAADTEIAESLVCAVMTSGLSAWVVGATQMDKM